MKLRIIDLGIRNPSFNPTEAQMTRYINLEESSAIFYTTDREHMLIPGSRDLNKDIYIDKLPKGIGLIKGYESISKDSRGVIYGGPNILHFSLKLRKDLLGDIDVVRTKLQISLIKLLKKLKVTTSNNPMYIRDNDTMILHDGKYKKISGLDWYSNNGWDVVLMLLAFKFNYELLNIVYNLKSQKMNKKGGVSDIREVILGLNEIKDNLIPKDVGLMLAKQFAEDVGIDYYIGDFSKDEWNYLNYTQPIMDKNNWVVK